MNDLLEVNYNNKKQITGTDLLFNNKKISSEVASLSSSSLSSLSSRSSARSGRSSDNRANKSKSKNKNNKNLFLNNNINDDDDDINNISIPFKPNFISQNQNLNETQNLNKPKKRIEIEDDDSEAEVEDDDSEAEVEDDDSEGEVEDDDEEGDDDDEDDDDDNKSLTSNQSGDSSRIVKSKKDIIKEKREILYQLNRLEAKGYTIPNCYNMQSDLTEMKREYERIVRDRDIDSSVRFQRKMLMAFVTGTEYLNTRYDPFAIKLDGWSEQVHDNINDYDDIFEELHEKYKAKGKKMAPELRLFISLTGSAFMFHLTSKMFKESSIPGVEEVFKANPELMKQFQSAAAKQFVYKNTGIDTSQPQRSSGGGGNRNDAGGGLFGMIGNLFGGLTGSPPPMMNSSPNMGQRQFQNSQQQPQSQKDIMNVINNVHNKITPHLDEDSRIETLSISDEEITSIIEDATDLKLLNKSVRGKNKRTLNI
jgi:hypothetical protein